MANCKKATRGAMGHLMKHYERSKDVNGEYIKFGNQQIDIGRTHLNYNLAPERNQLDFIHKRLSEVYVLKRKDVNVMCSWVITVPKELPEEYQKEFFERTYRFLQQRYSPDEKNIISSYVHLDEATPHMHFAFIPVVYDNKKNREKISAKEVITRTDLSTFHKDLQNVMDKFVREYGKNFRCNVMNGATDSGNRSIEEYKAEKAIKYRKKVNKEILDIKRYGDMLAKDVGTLENKLNSLDAIVGSDETIIREFINHANIKPIFEKYRSHKRENIKKSQESREKRRESVKDALAKNQKRVSDESRPKQQHKHDLEFERYK